jgi:hypothetical protein
LTSFYKGAGSEVGNESKKEKGSAPPGTPLIETSIQSEMSIVPAGAGK